MSEANKRTVLTLNKVVWNTGDVSRIDEFIHQDFVADYRPQGRLRQGIDAAREMVRGAHETFEDFHEEMHDVVAEGDRVVAHFTVSGRQVGEWGVLPSIAPNQSRDYEVAEGFLGAVLAARSAHH